jgi:hypothetical protein
MAHRKDVYLPNGSFQRFRNDTLLVHAHFTISKVSSLKMLEFTDVRSYFNYKDEAFNEPVQVTIEKDTLIVGFLCCDTFQDWYVRTKAWQN